MLLHGCLVNRLNSRIVDRNMACVVGVGLGVLACAMGKLGFRIGAVWCGRLGRRLVRKRCETAVPSGREWWWRSEPAGEC